MRKIKTIKEKRIRKKKGKDKRGVTEVIVAKDKEERKSNLGSIELELTENTPL